MTGIPTLSGTGSSLVGTATPLTRKRIALVLMVLMVFCAFTGIQADLYSEKGKQGTNTNEREAISFLNQYSENASLRCTLFMGAKWNFDTNINDVNRRALVERGQEWTRFSRQKWEEATEFAWKNFTSPDVKRIFSFLTILGKEALPEIELQELKKLNEEMMMVYSTAKICKYDSAERRDSNGDYDYYDSEDDNEISCIASLPLEPHLKRIMSTSRDSDELRYTWKAWRDATGKPIRKKYIRLVELENKVARINGFNDAGDYWLKDYETTDFREQLEDAWEKLRPLYEQLHAYVRSKLRAFYGEETVPLRGPIPAHLLGTMWAQTWTDVLDLTIPYQGRSTGNITNALQRSRTQPTTFFQLANDFFKSIGLESMPTSFWGNSIFVKPVGREIKCQASAWDFCNRFDYRITQCSLVNMESFISAFREMGHLQYDLQYRNQHFTYRKGANPGIHEAVGDVMALFASTPRYLQSIELLSPVDDSYETDINFLFNMALDRIAFLPYSYLMDQWRWKVFSGETSTSDLNWQWWYLRNNLQGVSSPVPRDEEDFDPGATFHVSANVPYIRYFVSYIVQFQFHAELCKAAGHTGPMHQCDIYGSTQAGNLLRKVLSLGRSRPWPEVISNLTSGRTNKLDPRPMLEYFAPLQTWLESQNKQEFVGWEESEAIVAQLSAGISTTFYTLIIVGFIAIVLLVTLLIWAVTRCKRKGNSGVVTEGS